jgi:hypothetical protein
VGAISGVSSVRILTAMAGAGVGMIVGAAIGFVIVVIDNETLTEYATMVRKLISTVAFAEPVFNVVGTYG